MQEELIQQYLEQMNELERKAYIIAKEHLGTSFNVVRSNGYIAWLKEQQQQK